MQGKARLMTVSPVLSAGAYANGDQMGSALELTYAMDSARDTGGLLSVAVIDKASQNSAIDILFFSDIPVISSTDNNPLDIADSEMVAKFLGKVSITAASYGTLANCSVSSNLGIGLLLMSTKTDNLYIVVQSRGAGTYGVGDLAIKCGVVQD